MAVLTSAEINDIWKNRTAVLDYVYVCEDGMLYKGQKDGTLFRLLNTNLDTWKRYKKLNENDGVKTTAVVEVSNPILENNTKISESLIPVFSPIRLIENINKYNITVLDGLILVDTDDIDVTIKFQYTLKENAYVTVVFTYEGTEYKTTFSKIVTVKKVDSGLGSVIIDIEGSNLIDGATTYTLTRQYQSLTAQWDYVNWHITSSFGISDSDNPNNYVIKSASFTMTSADWGKTFEFTSGGFTQVFPTAVGNKNRWIECINASTSDILFDAYSTETIGNWSGDIGTTFNLLPGEVLKVKSNGTILRMI